MKMKHTPLALALALAFSTPMHVNASAQETEDYRIQRHGTIQDSDRPDAWVETKVKSKLAMSSEISSMDINVEANDGVVTLRGTVDNRAQEQEALRLARETVGANEVRSALVVNPRATDLQRDRNEMTPAKRREERQHRREERAGNSSAQDNDHTDRPDAWVTAKVKSKLAMSSEINALDINVDTEDGITTLRGTVDNRAQEQEALRLARETVGTNEVRSALVINPDATDRQRDRNEMTPAERREDRQERRQERREHMDGDRNRMHRDHHDTRDRQDRASRSRNVYRDARDDMHYQDRSMDRRDYLGHDRISNLGDNNRPDAWLLTKVKSQMLASSDVAGLGINVDVDDGVVTLRGTVDTHAEANEAIRIAQSTEGVRQVNSHLVISGD